MKNKEDKNSLFKETFKLLNNDIRKYRYRLSNDDFSIYERRLLRAFLDFRTNNRDVIDSLRSFTIQDNSFLESTRLYLLGISYNHYSKYSFAAEKLSQSIEIYEKLGEKDFASYAITSIILVYANKSNINAMKFYSDKLLGYEPVSEYHKYLILHAQSVYYLESNQDDKLNKILDEVMSTKSKAINPLKSYFIYVHFLINLRNKNYKMCFTDLEKLKKSKGFSTKIMYKYMKILLNHISHDKPLYLYRNELEDYPELLDQIEVIKALQFGNSESALFHWNSLAKHNPEVYAAGFSFSGSLCLFSICLEKHIDKIDEAKICEHHIASLGSKLEILDYIVKTHIGPIGKEQLIYFLWGDIEITENVDANLRNLIKKYRKVYGVKIKGLSGTYQLAS